MQARWRWWFYLAVLGLTLYLGYPYFHDVPRPYGMLDLGILPFHEAGHFVFGILGEFMGALGGTLVQVGMPLGFALYFGLGRKEPFAAFVCLFWMSQTLVNVSIYMVDAKLMMLPLFSGSDDVVHDWNYLFGRLHLLRESGGIGAFVALLGRLGMTASFAAMGAWLWRNRA